jgi:hypothetical protein
MQTMYMLSLLLTNSLMVIWTLIHRSRSRANMWVLFPFTGTPRGHTHLFSLSPHVLLLPPPLRHS